MNFIKMLFLLGWLVFCCSPGEGTKRAPEVPAHNFIVLLDLSDRLQDRNQVDRDIKVVTSIFSAFKSSVKKGMYIRSSDQFNVVVAPQKNEYQRDIISMENQLQINLQTATPAQKKKRFDEFEQQFPAKLKNLYSFAVRGKSKSSDYFGADIWKFFNDDLEDVIVPGAINHLFILTDGYIYFEDYGLTQHSKNRYASCQFMSELRENNWEDKFENGDYGIIPTARTYPNLNVMIVEVDPKPEFPNEYNLLTKIWTKWLWEMKIRNVRMNKISPIDKVNEDISEFTGLSLTRVGSVNPGPKLPETTKDTRLSGRFVGTLEGYGRELEIEEAFDEEDGVINFIYSIKGLGQAQRRKTGKLNTSDLSVEFETIGKGQYEIKNGRYILVSTKVSSWNFAQI